MRSVPFKPMPPKLCANPDCKKNPEGGPEWFEPKTPWQKCCCQGCNDHLLYLKSTKPKRQAKSLTAKQAEAIRQGEETPTVEHPAEAQPPPEPA